MSWVRRGVIYSASNQSDWAFSHAALPTPHALDESTLRLYCAFRDRARVSRVGYVDVSALDPRRILKVSASPVLDTGDPGSFDEHGVVPVCLVKSPEALRLYYGGFSRKANDPECPYVMFSGLAESRDGGESFFRVQADPILPPTPSERFFRTAPHVVFERGIWRMWYVAGSSWVTHSRKKLPLYSIKHLQSKDGICWGSEGTPCLEPKEDLHGFGRPFVYSASGSYQMFFSKRGFSGYRLARAVSADGLSWRNATEMFASASPPGSWDSEMQCYAAPFVAAGKRYLFYNGNDYGGTGMGFAEEVRT